MLPTRAKKTQTSDRILITGASGGLGSALALHYASPGVRLLLWGRNIDRLEKLAESCRQRGAEVAIRSLDLTDCAGAVTAIEEDDEAAPIGLALLAAGAGDILGKGDLAEAPGQVVRLATVNFTAPAAIAAAMAARMAERGGGGIVLIGSAAAFHALPFAAAYAGSKAGLARFAQALGVGVAVHGVSVTLVSPGFIDTPAAHKTQTAKPFMMSPGDVAARIARAAARGQRHLVLPWPFAVLRLIDRLLPARLRDGLLRRLAPPTG